MNITTRLTEELVSLAKSYSDDADEAAAPEGGGCFAKWAMISLHSLRIFLEKSYKMTIDLLETVTQDSTRRLLFVVISLFMQNVWRYLHWEYVAAPRRGGRRLWWWPFEEFIRMVTRGAWNALSVWREVPTKKPPDDRFTQ